MSDGTPWRPLLHVEDIAKAFIAVISSDNDLVNNEAFNVGKNDGNYQIKDIANLIKEKIPECEIVITGEHGSDSRSYKVNFNKINDSLENFNPDWDLKKGINQIYDAYTKKEMDSEKFQGRYFVRLTQLQHLLDKKLIDERLFWN